MKEIKEGINKWSTRKKKKHSLQPEKNQININYTVWELGITTHLNLPISFTVDGYTPFVPVMVSEIKTFKM